MILKQANTVGTIGKAYRYLLEEIIYNRVRPDAPLSETEIAGTLGISRTPVREALMRLAGEGIIVRYPSRGWFVAGITIRDVEEIYEIRTQLEVCALRTSCNLIAEQELEALERALDSLTPESPDELYFDSDRRLHSLLLAHCGNSRLVGFLSILDAQIERVRVISASRKTRLVNSRREHLELVHALRARDLPLAEELLTAHIANVRDNSLEVCKYMDMTCV